MGLINLGAEYLENSEIWFFGRKSKQTLENLPRGETNGKTKRTW